MVVLLLNKVVVRLDDLEIQNSSSKSTQNEVSEETEKKKEAEECSWSSHHTSEYLSNPIASKK
jgi:hypothetical protein